MVIVSKDQQVVSKTSTYEFLGSGSSKNSSFMKQVAATVRKDLQLTFRYKANFIGGFFQTIIFTGLFYIFALALTFRGFDLSANDRFMFFYVGILIVTFQSTALWAPIRGVQRDLHNGTLEYIYSTPGSRYAYFVGTSVADAIRNLFYFIPMFGFLVFWAEFNLQEILLGLILIVFSIIIFVSFGVLIGTMGIMYKQTESLTAILDTFLNFFAGAYIPLMVFPKALQYLAFLFPHAYIYDLMRYIAFKGNWPTIFPVELEIGLLVINFLVFIGLARFMLRRVERYAKKEGLHII